MNDSIAKYYKKELDYINKSSKDFSILHPNIAGRLGVNGGDSYDPFVERLIQSFAFLTRKSSPAG